MSIRNKILNLIDRTRYAGNVEISVYKGDVLVNKVNATNNGTVNLCKYICECMTGEYIIAKRPWRITPCKYQDDELVDITTFGILAKSFTAPEINSEAGSCSYVLTFNIPASILVGNTDKIEGLKLWAADMTDTEHAIYAILDLKTNPILVGSEKDASIIIKWKLTVSCK